MCQTRGAVAAWSPCCGLCSFHQPACCLRLHCSSKQPAMMETEEIIVRCETKAPVRFMHRYPKPCHTRRSEKNDDLLDRQPSHNYDQQQLPFRPHSPVAGHAQRQAVLRHIVAIAAQLLASEGTPWPVVLTITLGLHPRTEDNARCQLCWSVRARVTLCRRQEVTCTTEQTGHTGMSTILPASTSSKI